MTAIDRAALAFAERVVARQPRGDYTIAQLPPAVVVGPTDLVPIWHNGQTYAAPATLLAGGADVDGWVNVVLFGAKGDGVTDDSVAILTALAVAVTNLQPLYFPPGHYYYNSPTPITIPNGVSLLAFGDAQIIGGPATTDCFVFTQTQPNASLVSLPGLDFAPSVRNFYNGAALLIFTNNRSIWMNYAIACYYGVRFSSTNNIAIAANTVTVHQIQQCYFGVCFIGDATANFESTIVNCNLVYACAIGIGFLIWSGATYWPVARGIVLNIVNIDNGGVIGGTICGRAAPAPWYGIWSTPILAVSDYVVNVQGGFGSFVTGWIGVATPLHTNVDYYLNIGGITLAYLSTFGKLANGSHVTFVTQLTPGGINLVPTVLAPTYVVAGNAARCYITWTAGAAVGGVIDGYGYAFGVTGNTPVVVSLQTTLPVVVIAAEDESLTGGSEGQLPNAFQFHVRLLAVGTVPPGSVINMLVKIGP